MNKHKNKFFPYSLILLFCGFVFNGFSQHFIFELTPGLKFYGSSFQETTGTITQGGNNSYAFSDIKRVSTYDKLGFISRFGLEPELSLAFLELNKKWKFNFGLTTYIVKSKLNASTTGKSYLTYVDSTTTFTEYISKQLITRYQQFYVSATRTFSTQTKLDKVFLNKLTLGFGLNRPSIFNTRNEKEFYVTYLYDHYGYEKEITFKKSPFFGFLNPVLIFRYDMMFQTKKHSAGLFNLFVTYVQGFSDQYDFTLTSSSIGGASLNVKSENRGSGIRFGISKTFKFDKKTQNEEI